MRTKRLIAAAAVTALAVTGCGGGGDDGKAEGTSGGTLRLGLLGEGPPHLSPFRSADTSSSAIVDKIYAGLVKYNATTSEAENLIAESFTTEDNVTWTVEIKEGWTFQNGEKITAQTFVDSWNFTANPENAPDNTAFHARTVGYADAEEGGEMSGLEVIDDKTFKVTFDGPWLAFPTAMGYLAYYPLAEECRKDADECDKTPIGNGPMVYPEGADKSVEIELKQWEDYKGEKPQVDTVLYKVYADQDAMWAAFQADEIDLGNPPDEQYPAAVEQIGDRLLKAASPSFTYVGFPVTQKPFDDPKVRQALNLAVDRDAVREAAFQGRHVSATSFTPPEVIPGGVEGTCGYCEVDIDRAKELLEEAGGWPEGMTLELYANEGAGHEKWLQVVGDQIKANLGIPYEIELTTWDEYLKLNTSHSFKGPFRLGWAPDYPLNENYLTGVYGGGVDGNGMGYENKEFTDLLKQGDSAETIEDAIKLYQDAERVVGEDMPNMPLFFAEAATFVGPNVDIDSVVYGALNDWNWDLIKVLS